MKSPSLASALAFGLVVASASTARADDSRTDASLLAAPATFPTHVRVHLVAPRSVRLESRAPGESAWVLACNAPCDRELPLADEYRYMDGTPGTVVGRPFSLDAAAGSAVLLRVEPASVAGEVGGGVLIGLGGVLGGLSVVGLVTGAAYASAPAPTCGPESSTWCGSGQGLGQALALVSGIGLVIAGGIVAGGVLVMAGSEATTTQKPWAGREPTWTAPRASAPGRTALVTPLSFSF